MEQVKAFVETLEDLRHRCSLTATEYDAVQAAGLIRRLVIDGFSLGMEQARAMDIVPMARWCVLNQLLGEQGADERIELAGLYMDPELLTELGGATIPKQWPQIIVEKPVKRFLEARAVVQSVADEEVEVVRIHDLVKHYAIREGGVHYSGETKSPLLRLARDEFEEELRLILITAGRIIYRAFEPALIRAAFPEHILNPRFTATVDDVVGVTDEVEAEMLLGGDTGPN